MVNIQQLEKVTFWNLGSNHSDHQINLAFLNDLKLNAEFCFHWPLWGFAFATGSTIAI